MANERDLPALGIAIRVGDVERHACLVSLIDHHLQGRLTTVELDRRQALAMSAVTTDDLDVLLCDLPRAQAGHVPSRTARVSALLHGRTPSAAWALVTILPVYGAGMFGQFLFQYSAEGHYYTAALAGTVGYAAHAVTTRLRR